MSSKSEWPPGPWQSEPDEKEWTHAGFRCRIRRGPMGHWCGYIGVESGHPLYGRNDDTIWDMYRPKVHGGLTWSNTFHGEDSTWWIGFDCAHYGDAAPGMAVVRGRTDFFSDEVYRDVDYVVSETENLAEQLARAIAQPEHAS